MTFLTTGQATDSLRLPGSLYVRARLQLHLLSALVAPLSLSLALRHRFLLWKMYQEVSNAEQAVYKTISTANPPARRRALANVGNALSLEQPRVRACIGRQKRHTLLPSSTRTAPSHPTAHSTTRKAPTPIPLKPRLTRVPTASNPPSHPAPIRAAGGPTRTTQPNRQQDGSDAQALENRTGALKPERNAPRLIVQRGRGAPYTTTHPARTSARRLSLPHNAALPLPLREQRPVDRALAARDMWPAGPARRAQGELDRLSVEQQLPTPPSSMRVRGPGVHALLSGAAASQPVSLSSPPLPPPPPPPPPPSAGMATSLVSLMRSLSGQRNSARGGTEDGWNAEGAGCSFTMELDETNKETLLGLTLSGLGAPAYPASPDVDSDFTPLAGDRGTEWSAGKLEAVRRIEAVGVGGGAAFAARDEVERAMEKVCEACLRLCKEWEALDALLGRADVA
ncbi:hypothetical protein HETIRDRAFT_458443 [Heterobasidion irregulare TC 32-1]|uniref:Uncharacterized protein n=1 Tax=Heterobasidion irregulare (strain TC 32-1) TaxID=747525 RepID=W4KA18_HETIT|nr:uncharacterized protein HETIRDRAFT_458443 [Heterobasidion irregulare TC 32-1]ETW82623.1 hypothetical protein HETIRDRAFT_458443 [Heterobasidion irregulare TC 32-1]